MADKTEIENRLMRDLSYRQAVIQHLTELEHNTDCELQVIGDAISKMYRHLQMDNFGENPFKLYTVAEGHLPFLIYKHNIIAIRQALMRISEKLGVQSPATRLSDYKYNNDDWDADTTKKVNEYMKQFEELL